MKDQVEPYEVSDRIGWSRLQETMVEVFDRWLSERKLEGYADFSALGELLYRALLDNQVGAALRDLVDNATADDPVRLELEMSEAPDLAVLPWEFVRDPRPPDVFLGTDSRISLTRYLPQPFPPQGGRRGLKVLFAVAQPRGLGPVASTDVASSITQLGEHHSADVIHEENVIFRRFAELVKTERPDVVHYAGHGRFEAASKQSKLAFLDDDGSSPAWIAEHDLVEVFRDHAPRLVVLQACESGRFETSSRFAGFAPRILERGVPALVAMQYPVRVAAAVNFATEFYRRLDADEPVDRAVQAGRRSVNDGLASAYHEREFGAPVLYLRGRGQLLPDGDGDDAGEPNG